MREYKTVNKQSEAVFVEKKSKFIGHIKPVQTQQEAVEFINEIKSKNWDATHNVYAYVLRDGQIQRYSDDGEPQGTAGIPVLDVLLKENLTDVAVVVTRYFGGIMLGAGGLVRAYSHSSKIAVDAGEVVTMALCSVCQIKCDYNYYDKLTIILAQNGANIRDTFFQDVVTVEFLLKGDDIKPLNDLIVDNSNGKFSVSVLSKEFAKIK